MRVMSEMTVARIHKILRMMEKRKQAMVTTRMNKWLH
jgi:hypothetical protein